jgi:hypothetical protein
MTETTFVGITISNLVMIIAVIAGPILAVQIQKYIEGKREAKERKIHVFKDLMATRASTLAYQHVVAINLVGLEFQGKEFSKVVNAWKTYLDHLGSYPNDDESMAKIWGEKRNDQLSDLLYEMGISLGFEFDKVHIKKAGYVPKAYTDREQEQDFIRRAVADVFLGKRELPMKVTSFPMDQSAVDAQKQLQKAITEHYASGKPFPVQIVEGKA